MCGGPIAPGKRGPRRTCCSNACKVKRSRSLATVSPPPETVTPPAETVASDLSDCEPKPLQGGAKTVSRELRPYFLVLEDVTRPPDGVYVSRRPASSSSVSFQVHKSDGGSAGGTSQLVGDQPYLQGHDTAPRPATKPRAALVSLTPPALKRPPAFHRKVWRKQATARVIPCPVCGCVAFSASQTGSLSRRCHECKHEWNPTQTCVR
jgi:hypothetical protein